MVSERADDPGSAWGCAGMSPLALARCCRPQVLALLVLWGSWLQGQVTTGEQVLALALLGGSRLHRQAMIGNMGAAPSLAVGQHHLVVEQWLYCTCCLLH